MSESIRMVDGAREPNADDVADWIGPQNFKRWTELRGFIDSHYGGVFNVEWLFGGNKHGWSLRYKKSKSFCTLIPERGRFNVLLVFGGSEQEKIEAILSTLLSHVRDDYRKSAAYPDGRWVLITVDSMKVVKDVKRLLELKRKPKPAVKIETRVRPLKARTRGGHRR